MISLQDEFMLRTRLKTKTNQELLDLTREVCRIAEHMNLVITLIKEIVDERCSR